MPIEVNTPDCLKYLYYTVVNGCIAFKVRAPNDAHLALCTGPKEESNMYEVFLGAWDNARSVIRKNGTKPEPAEVKTPGILNAGEFRGFWIRWHDNVIRVGREGEVAAVLSYEDSTVVKINYVGVCTAWGAAGTWIFEESQCSAPIMGCAPPTGLNSGCWVPAADGEVPPGAVKGGIDGPEQLFIARARHQGTFIPGKLHPSYRLCYIPCEGVEHEYNEYEVLCASSGVWIPVADGNIPTAALQAGESKRGEPLFIGRANHHGTITIGKVRKSNGVCYIPYGGREFVYSQFEIFISQ